MPTTDVDTLDGVQITILGSMLVCLSADPWSAISQTLNRGDLLEITDEVVAASRDRFGDSWLALLDDPEGQQARYGKQMFVRGAIALTEPWETRGDAVWRRLRDEDRKAAFDLQDPAERQRALAAIERKFGKPEHDEQSLGWFLR